MADKVVNIRENTDQRKAAEYIMNLAAELISLANESELATLAYLLKLVELEADNCVRANTSMPKR